VLSVEQAFPTRVAGVIRADNADTAFQARMAVIEAGIATVEVTMTVPSCMEIVRGLVHRGRNADRGRHGLGPRQRTRGQGRGSCLRGHALPHPGSGRGVRETGPALRAQGVKA